MKLVLQVYLDTYIWFIDLRQFVVLADKYICYQYQIIYIFNYVLHHGQMAVLFSAFSPYDFLYICYFLGIYAR